MGRYLLTGAEECEHHFIGGKINVLLDSELQKCGPHLGQTIYMTWIVERKHEKFGKRKTHMRLCCYLI